ncbi:radical SAM protein [Candidatus Peregrinibacteria bacterium]|nr:radical SAM protein [Candidatus Peregrinibacteria bacterium]
MLPSSPKNTTSSETMRLSLASAALLGLKNARIQAKTKTIYLMNSGKCQFNCNFCAQAKESTSEQKMLSRVSWPEYQWKEILNSLDQKSAEYKRVCMQVVNTRDIFDSLPNIVRKIREKSPKTKIAMTVRTRLMKHIDGLFEAGTDEVGLSIDAIDPIQFQKIKGGDLEGYIKFILRAADKYPEKIATHLIIGMGETEQQSVAIMEELHAHKVIIALFAFTPVRGAKMEFERPPDTHHYRRIQIALHLLRNDLPRNFHFDSNGKILSFGVPKDKLFKILKNSNVFETSGCTDCNRPYYNERAGSKDPFNYPYELSEAEFGRIWK